MLCLCTRKVPRLEDFAILSPPFPPALPPSPLLFTLLFSEMHSTKKQKLFHVQDVVCIFLINTFFFIHKLKMLLFLLYSICSLKKYNINLIFYFKEDTLHQALQTKNITVMIKWLEDHKVLG